MDINTAHVRSFWATLKIKFQINDGAGGMLPAPLAFYFTVYFLVTTELEPCPLFLAITLIVVFFLIVIDFDLPDLIFADFVEGFFLLLIV